MSRYSKKIKRGNALRNRAFSLLNNPKILLTDGNDKYWEKEVCVRELNGILMRHKRIEEKRKDKESISKESIKEKSIIGFG